MSRPVPSRRQSGFTLLELLIVVAVIGIIAAAAIPALQRAILKAKVARLASDSKLLFGAFVQYNVDRSSYPSTTTPIDRAFNRKTLDPLVANGYLRSGKNLVAHLDQKQVTDYDSPNVGVADSEFWAVLTLDALPTVQVVVADTTQFPGFIGTHIQGGYFVYGTKLLPLDDKILEYLGK